MAAERRTEEAGVAEGTTEHTPTTDRRTRDVEAIVAEARKTADTAERLANGEYPDGADHVRVLAGMVHQVAEQVERLAGLLR